MRHHTPPVGGDGDRRTRRCSLHQRSASPLADLVPSTRTESQAAEALPCIYARVATTRSRRYCNARVSARERPREFTAEGAWAGKELLRSSGFAGLTRSCFRPRAPL